MQNSHKIGELGDNALHQLEHLVHRCKDRLTIDNLRLVERYLKGELHLLLVLKTSRFGVDFIADLERLNRATEVCVGDEAQNSTSIRPATDDINHSLVVERSRISELVPHSCGDKESVFVNIVQSAELPEKVIPTLVRLERVDSINALGTEFLYFSTTLRRHVVIKTLPKREMNILLGSAGRIGSHQSECEIVKSASQIVENVSDDCGNSARNLRDELNVDDLISVRILLSSEEITVFREGIQSNFEITDVLFGPFDF